MQQMQIAAMSTAYLTPPQLPQGALPSIGSAQPLTSLPGVHVSLPTLASSQAALPGPQPLALPGAQMTVPGAYLNLAAQPATFPSAPASLPTSQTLVSPESQQILPSPS